jgi:hypothetical protein
MEERTKGTVEETPLSGLVTGGLLFGFAAFFYMRPDKFAEKWWLPWVIGLAALIGVCMILGNSATLYGIHVRKLDRKAADAFAGGAIGSGIVGSIKWGGLVACLFLGYNYLNGPFATLDHGTKVLSGLLALAVILLFYIAVELEKIRKKP